MKRSYNEYRMMAAFNLLMERYEYDDVSVSMITGVCGLSRQSFYKYFESKQVLCSRMTASFFRDCLGGAEDFTWEELIRRYIGQIGDYMDLFHVFETLPLFRSAEESLNRAVCGVCFAMHRHRNGSAPGRETAEVIRFYASGVAWSLIELVRRGIPADREMMRRRIILSEPEMLKDLLEARYPESVYASAFPGVEKGGMERIRRSMEELSSGSRAQIAQKAK